MPSSELHARPGLPRTARRIASDHSRAPRSARLNGLTRPALAAGALVLLAGCPMGGGMGGPDKPTRGWLAQLESSDTEGRRTAIRMLSERRGQALYVVPALIEALDDEDPIVQKTAAEGLRSLLGKPDLPDSRSAWEQYWRREKGRLLRKEKETPEERLKKQKAAIKNDEGYLEMMRGNFQGAEALFLEAVSEDPQDARFWNNLGKCNANMGQWPKAIDRYRRAIEEDPAFGPAHYNIAEAFLMVSKLTDSNRTYAALGEVDAAIRLDRKNKDWPARWLKARILHHMALAEPGVVERIELYKLAGEAAGEAKKIITRSKRTVVEEAEVRKTAALIAYGRELYYRAYKDVVKVYELGYEMDPDFVSRLDEALRREALKRGTRPPPMPKGPDEKKPDGPPPALILPHERGSR